MGKFWVFVPPWDSWERCSSTPWSANQNGAPQALLIIRFSNYSTPTEECAPHGCVCSLFQQLLSRSGLHWTPGPWAGCAAGQSPLLPCCLPHARWWTAAPDPSWPGDKGNLTIQFKITEWKEALVVNTKKEKGRLWTARLSLGALQILVERKAECRLRDLPGELRIPLPANGSLCSLLFVPSGQSTAALWIDSLYGWPHTHYQPRLCPLGCLSKSCSSFFCNDFTAATLQRKLPRKANVSSVWSLCSRESAENTAKPPPGCVLVIEKFCLLLFIIYREIRDQFTAFNIPFLN